MSKTIGRKTCADKTVDQNYGPKPLTKTTHFWLRGRCPRTPIGGAAPKPSSGDRWPPNPPAGGVIPPTPPRRRRVYNPHGCEVHLGYNSWLKQRSLNLEGNQAPQPTISHLETDHNNSTAAVLAGLGPGKFLISSFILEGQLKLSRNSVSPWLLPLSTYLQDSG